MKPIEQLEQEAKQAREDMREVMLDEFGIGATLSDRILSLMIRAVQSNIAHNDAKYEVSGNSDSCDGWIDWKGGSCPIDENVKVELKFRSSQYENIIDYAGGFSWYPKDDGTDIIAYRIVKGE